jgi:hypothetical protein
VGAKGRKKIVAGPRQHIDYLFRVPRLWEPSEFNLEHQLPVFISPSDRVSELYPLYNSQGYDGDIPTKGIMNLVV